MLSMFPGYTDLPDSCLYDDVTGVILAGGRATRMGEVDKGLQLLKGKPLISHVIDRLVPQVSTLIVNANRNLERYADFGWPVVSDEPRNYAGPLAGFLCGLEHARTLYLLTCPCDTPHVPRNLVETLFDALKRGNADLAVAHTREGNDLLPQPAICLVDTRLKSNLAAFLESGGHRIAAWYEKLKVAKAVFENPDDFVNINTLSELTEINNREPTNQKTP